ncbi:CS1 type fimbrial major subunit [Pseudomonas brassicacearum]|uniref:Adhesin n=1 Tax=Pseudomonas brassicacearum TaxID=930166 RepID=A0A423GNN6_9PSED|nr:CS1 type fimbrial major subunit [Pseudomonas brassicacearum]ROM93896.1 hypothetical protein BK658_19765 [Pseudomonas brassicacearum]
MIKKLIRVVLLVASVVGSSLAFAVREEAVFELSVSIPTSEFYVIPVNPDWIGREQVLGWNVVTSDLSPLRENFDVKNSSGGITARLESQPYLSNGNDDIQLKVMFNTVELTLSDTVVISAAEAGVGKRVALEIAAIKPVTDYEPGDYYGSVQVLFEAVAP